MSGSDEKPTGEAEPARDDADADTDVASDRPEPPAPRPRWRRLAPLVLLGGAAAAVVSLLPHVPHERQVEFQLEDPSTVVGLDVSWTDLENDKSSDDTLQEGRWNFAAGSAPRALVTTVRLPDGNYEVDVTIKRAEGARSLRRTLTLGDGERIIVTLR